MKSLCRQSFHNRANISDMPNQSDTLFTHNTLFIWYDSKETVHYSTVITRKRQFVCMLAQLAKVSFRALTTSFALGEKLFLGLLRLKISSFVESKPMPIALFLVFTVLTLALKSNVISTAMSVQLHERKAPL